MNDSKTPRFMQFIREENRRLRANPVGQSAAYLSLIAVVGGVVIATISFFLRWLLQVPLSYLVYFFAVTSIVWPVVVMIWISRKWQSTVEPFSKEVAGARVQIADLHVQIADQQTRLDDLASQCDVLARQLSEFLSAPRATPLSSDGELVVDTRTREWAPPILDSGPAPNIWESGVVDAAAFGAIGVGSLSVEQRRQLASRLRAMTPDSDEFLQLAVEIKDYIHQETGGFYDGMPLNEINRWVSNHALYDFLQDDFIPTHLDDSVTLLSPRVVRVQQSIDAINDDIARLEKLRDDIWASDLLRFDTPSEETLNTMSNIDHRLVELTIERSDLEGQLRGLESR